MCEDENGYDQFFLKGGNTSSGTGGIMYFKGDVGIGTTNPGYKLDVQGTGNFTGSVTAPTLTARTIDCYNPDDNGVAQISAYGTSQGTGRLYVGQRHNLRRWYRV